MTKFDKLFAKARSVYAPAGMDNIEKYIETGDMEAFAGLAPAYLYIAKELVAMLPAPEQMEAADARLLLALTAINQVGSVRDWLNEELKAEEKSPGRDVFGAIRKAMLQAGMKDEQVNYLARKCDAKLEGSEDVNSFGRYVLSLGDKNLHEVIYGVDPYRITELMRFLLKHAPQRINEELVMDLLGQSHIKGHILASLSHALIENGRDAYIGAIQNAADNRTDEWGRHILSKTLFEAEPGRYRLKAFEAARAVLRNCRQDSCYDLCDVVEWMLQNIGKEALGDIVAFLQSGPELVVSESSYDLKYGVNLMRRCAEISGGDATEIFLAALPVSAIPVRLVALEEMIKLQLDGCDDAIQAGIERIFSEGTIEQVVKAVRLCGQWNNERMDEALWKLMPHKSKQVRNAAAGALARRGAAVVERAQKLLAHKKADVRLAAVKLLAKTGVEQTRAILENHLDTEESNDVRDAVCETLDAIWEAEGKEVSIEEIQRRVARAGQSIAKPPAPWADPKILPPLYFRDGSQLSEDMVRYLLYRQSRHKEMRLDIEAKPLFRRIDRQRSGDFAQAVIQGFLVPRKMTWEEYSKAAGSCLGIIEKKIYLVNALSSESWVLALACGVGDDRLVDSIMGLIKTWTTQTDNQAPRGNIAEYAATALSLLGTDKAVMALDSIVYMFRAKWKPIGKAAAEAFAQTAAARGVTVEELGDLVVPWAGFEKGKTRIIEEDGKRVSVSVGRDFKFQYRDGETGRVLKSLPKTAFAGVLKELKDQEKNLKAAAKVQIRRLENLMVRQRRWPTQPWGDLFLWNPVLKAIAQRIVWGQYGNGGSLLGSFIVLEDGSLAGLDDAAVDLDVASDIGIIHPLDLEAATLAQWRTHLADYEIDPAFPQIDRPVIRVADDEKAKRACTKVSGTKISGMTFRGRADRLGWSRGPINDKMIPFYSKEFPVAGTTFFLLMEDMCIVMDQESDMEIALLDGFFVRSNSSCAAQAMQNDTISETDDGVIPLGEVAPLPFSEVMADLQTLSSETGGSVESGS